MYFVEEGTGRELDPAVRAHDKTIRREVYGLDVLSSGSEGEEEEEDNDDEVRCSPPSLHGLQTLAETRT